MKRAVFLAGLLTLQVLPRTETSAEPFGFFRPTVLLTAGDRDRLERGEALQRVLPALDGEVAIFAAIRVNADGRRLTAWVRAIGQLLKSPIVPEIARFSSPPRLDDLDGFALDDDDLSAIQRCQPGDCELKLAASEIALLQTSMAAERGNRQRAAQGAFRRVMLERVQAYLASGHEGLPASTHRDEPMSLPDPFSLIVHHSAYLGEHLPLFADYLVRAPFGALPNSESFVYWSKERLAGRTIVSATQVSILQPGDDSLPEVVVAGRQIFATRYLSGLLNITTIVRGTSGQHYLVYLNRSHVDVLTRWFGSVARMVIEHRVKSEAADVLQGLRQRLESGPP
jgi:hypothetical protein